MSSNNYKSLSSDTIEYNPQTSTSTQIRVDCFATGIGYGINTIPDILAATVLCIYCAFAINYVVWSACSGLSSNSWDSVAELMTLAFNSRRPPQLKDTSAGVETMSVFREPIKIMENEEKSLEIVFEMTRVAKGFIGG